MSFEADAHTSRVDHTKRQLLRLGGIGSLSGLAIVVGCDQPIGALPHPSVPPLSYRSDGGSSPDLSPFGFIVNPIAGSVVNPEKVDVAGYIKKLEGGQELWIANGLATSNIFYPQMNPASIDPLKLGFNERGYLEFTRSDNRFATPGAEFLIYMVLAGKDGQELFNRYLNTRDYGNGIDKTKLPPDTRYLTDSQALIKVTQVK